MKMENDRIVFCEEFANYDVRGLMLKSLGISSKWLRCILWDLQLMTSSSVSEG